MSYTPEPIQTEKQNFKVPVVVIILLAIVAGLGVYHRLVIDKPVSTSRRVLDPGFHFIDKRPFIVKVDHEEAAFLEEHRWHYRVSYSNVIIIHPGHVGVIIQKSNRGVNPEPLKPGIYRLDLELYEVRHVNTEPQEFRFGGEPQTDSE